MKPLGAAHKAAQAKFAKHKHIPREQLVAYSIETFGGASDDVVFFNKQIIKHYNSDRATLLLEEVKGLLKYGRRAQMMIASAYAIIACYGVDRARSARSTRRVIKLRNAADDDL